MENIYYGYTINESPTIAVVAAEDLTNARGKAIKMEEGKAKLCSTAGENVFGLAIYQGRNDIKKDEEFSVQIKDIGMAIAGEALKIGDFVSNDDQGRLVKASSGFAFGVAVTDAEAADTPFYVQITKTGPAKGGE